MDINKLPLDIKNYIMVYLEDNPIIFKILYYKKIQQYNEIYKKIMIDPSKAYVISGPSTYTRNKDIDHQIYQFSNYLFLSNDKLLADYSDKPTKPTYLKKKLNTLNIFINEVIKIIHNKNTLQQFYPGIVEDIIITIQSNNNGYFKYIDKNLTVNINSFS